MVELFSLDEPFGLRQQDIEYLRRWPPRRVYHIPDYSVTEAIYLAIGASFRGEKLITIMFPGRDMITAWPMWNVEQRCAFVLGFHFDCHQRPIAWVAKEASYLLAICKKDRFAGNDKAWDWAGYTELALDAKRLESGVLILNGSFRTSYRFASHEPTFLLHKRF
jgi:hypothetical protein